MSPVKYYKEVIEPLNISMAKLRKEHYTDIDGITHIYVKDENEIKTYTRNPRSVSSREFELRRDMQAELTMFGDER